MAKGSATTADRNTQERKRLIADLRSKTKTGQIIKVPFKGHTESLEVIRIPTADLRFNIQLGRLVLDRATTLYVEGDPEDPQAQHQIEEKILALKDTPILKGELRRDGQLEAGIVTEDGYVINGNRRLACLRTLEHETGDQRFIYMDVGVLPKASNKELFLLEASLQMTPETRARYGPVTTAVQIRRGLTDFGLEKKVVAEAMRMDEDELQDRLDILELIDGYLAFVSRPHDYTLVEPSGEPEPDAKQGKWWVFFELSRIYEQFRSDPRADMLLEHLYLRVADGASMDDMRAMKRLKSLPGGLDLFATELDRAAKTIQDGGVRKAEKVSKDKKITALNEAIGGVHDASHGKFKGKPIMPPDRKNLAAWKPVAAAAWAETMDTLANAKEKGMPVKLLTHALKKMESVDFAAAVKAARLTKDRRRSFKITEAEGLLRKIAKRQSALVSELKKLRRS